MPGGKYRGRKIREAKDPAKAQKAPREIGIIQAKTLLASPATSTFAPPVLGVEFPSLETTSLKTFEKKSKRSSDEEEDEDDKEIRHPEGQDARKFLDGPSLGLERGSKIAQDERSRVQETTPDSSRNVAQHASNILDRPSLAREGNSTIDRGLGSTRLSIAPGIIPPIEELRKQRKFAESKPKRFQEDDERYEEKACNQREFMRKLILQILLIALLV